MFHVVTNFKVYLPNRLNLMMYCVDAASAVVTFSVMVVVVASVKKLVICPAAFAFPADGIGHVSFGND